MNIGSEVKRLRKANGLTQQELASRLELTKGYISQIENNLTSPSIATLTDLLQCLGTDLSDFFSKEKDDQIIFNEDDIFIKEDDKHQYKMQWLIPNSNRNDMEPVVLEIENGGRTDEEEPHSGEEFGYILEGSIELILGDKRYKAKKGQSFYYRADSSHYIINNGKRKAKLLWVSTPPFF